MAGEVNVVRARYDILEVLHGDCWHVLLIDSYGEPMSREIGRYRTEEQQAAFYASDQYRLAIEAWLQRP